MTDIAAGARSVVLERDLPYPPERVWRALTRAELLADWLMQTDFAPDVGRGFTFRADWGSVAGTVLEVEPPRRLVYRWDALGLASVVTWTLAPREGGGTRLTLEQAGFRPDQEPAYQGAKVGWARFLARLDEVVAREAPQ